MSKKKKNCCCCCVPNYMNNSPNSYLGNCCEQTGSVCWEAIIFWLIACGAGLLNTSSILIILLFLLCGSSGDCCSNNLFGM